MVLSRQVRQPKARPISREVLSPKSVTHVTASLALGTLDAVVYVGPSYSGSLVLVPLSQSAPWVMGFVYVGLSMPRATL